MFAAISIVQNGDTTIDEYTDLTIDKAILGEHVISDKAPGMTILSLPTTYIVDQNMVFEKNEGQVRQSNRQFETYLRHATRYSAWFVNGMLVGMSVVVLYFVGLRVFSNSFTATPTHSARRFGVGVQPSSVIVRQLRY